MKLRKVKMKLLFTKLLFILFLIEVLNGHFCKVKFQFKKVCNRVEINNDCQPPLKTEKCKRLRTTVNDFKCPTYDCVSYDYLRPSNSQCKCTLSWMFRSIYTSFYTALNKKSCLNFIRITFSNYFYNKIDQRNLTVPVSISSNWFLHPETKISF